MMFNATNGQINTNGEQTDYISFGKGHNSICTEGLGHCLYEEARDFIHRVAEFCNR